MSYVCWSVVGAMTMNGMVMTRGSYTITGVVDAMCLVKFGWGEAGMSWVCMVAHPTRMVCGVVGRNVNVWLVVGK